MADNTNRLGLKRAYWADPANVMDAVGNWNILDAYIGAFHDHDGVNSAPIDPASLEWIVAWLMRLEAKIETHETRITNMELFYELFYDEFLRHNHTGAQTLWVEPFANLSQTNADLSTAMVSPAQKLLSLPADYQPGRSYYHVGLPFALNPDPDPDPEKLTSARGRIISRRRGEVVPYLAVGDDLLGKANTSNTYLYPGAARGQRLTEGTQTVISSRSKHDFQQKVRGRMEPNLSEAHHQIGVGEANRPHPNKSSHKFPHGGEFSQAEYDTLNRRDSTYVVTAQNARRGQTFYDAAEARTDHEAKPLYDDVGPLSWDREANRFYWFDSDALRFTPLSEAQAGAFHHDALTGIAATVDRDTGLVWALKTFNVERTTPRGHFDSRHQIVSYNPKTGAFREGAVWTSLSHAKSYYTPSVTISPTRLEIEGGKLYILTELDALRSKAEGVEFVNYYGSFALYSNRAALGYQWLPFGTLYPEALLNSEGYVNFAAFNPGVLGTIHTLNLRAVQSTPASWVPVGPAKIIDGAFSRAGSYAALPETHPPEAAGANVETNADAGADAGTDAGVEGLSTLPGEGVERSVEGFEGVNTKLYLGLVAGKMHFYQAFCPYNPSAVLDTDAYLSEEWLQRHGGAAWHGFVEYDIAGGTSRLYTGNVPWLAGCGGSMGEGRIVLAEGLELAEQIVEASPGDQVQTSRTRLLSAEDFSGDNPDAPVSVASLVSANAINARQSIVVNPTHPKASARINASERILIEVNRNTGASTRVSATQSVRVGSSGGASINVQHSVVITGGGSVNARQSVVIIGGRQCPPRKTRPRPVDPPKKIPEKAESGILNGSRARQMFLFHGLDVEPEDIVRVHLKARTYGAERAPQDIPGLTDMQPYHVRTWTSSGEWDILQVEEGRREDEEKVWFTTLDPGLNRTLKNPDMVPILVEAVPASRASENQVSRLELDYIYLSVESPAYVEEYEWSDLPQGSQAALVLECKNDAKVDRGVEVKAVQLDVDSSK